MSGDRLPTRALHCYIPGRRSRGRPCKKWINHIQEDLNCLQLNMKEAMDIVRDRQEWRHRISTSSSPLGWRASKMMMTKQDRASHEVPWLVNSAYGILNSGWVFVNNYNTPRTVEDPCRPVTVLLAITIGCTALFTCVFPNSAKNYEILHEIWSLHSQENH